MTHISFRTWNTPAIGKSAPFVSGAICADENAPQTGLVEIIDEDAEVRRQLTNWAAAAGMDARPHTCLNAFEASPCTSSPRCLVIDAQPLAIMRSGPDAALSQRKLPCPVIVTAYQPDVSLAVRIMKTGALDFVEKPLREHEIVAAFCAAIELDRQQRLLAARHADLQVRFSALSRRERQVMALVTAGKLNKQVAGDLSLSEITVKAHRGSVMRKMQARSLAELVRMADAIGDLLSPARSGCLASLRTAAVEDRRRG